MSFPDPPLYLAFIGASAVLALIPGPVVTMLVATGIHRGRTPALAALGGSTSALAVHAVLVWAGLAAAIAVIGPWFEWVRWAGAAYLVWLGIAAWRESPVPLATEAGASRRDLWRHYRRGLLIGLTNPKTLAFYAAFFPQFISPGAPAAPQLAVLCLTFVAVGTAIDGGYTLLASSARTLFARPAFARWRGRISGTLLIAAGGGLALSRS